MSNRPDPTATPTPTPTPVPPTPTPRAETPAGRILFTHDNHIWQWSPGDARQITTGIDDSQPAWSPDGTQIAYVETGRGYSDVLVLEVATGRVRTLTQNRVTIPVRGTWVFRPAWSPDGSTIAFVSDAASYHMALWLMGASGTSRRMLGRWGDGRGGLDDPAWSPDGRQIAIAAYPAEGPSQIQLVDVRTAGIRQLTASASNAYDPAWAPNGRMIAFATVDPTGSYLWVMPVDRGEPRQVVPDNRCRAPAWSPDGAWLAYISGQPGGRFGVFAVRINGGEVKAKPVPLTGNLSVAVAGGLSWGA